MIVDQKPSYIVEDNGMHTSVTSESTTLSELLAYYEQEMLSYIYAIPHIPPTLFELKLRHERVKRRVMKMFDSDTNKAAIGGKLDGQIEKAFASVVAKNIHEYKICQAGFIIGWKCSANSNGANRSGRAID